MYAHSLEVQERIEEVPQLLTMERIVEVPQATWLLLHAAQKTLRTNISETKPSSGQRSTTQYMPCVQPEQHTTRPKAAAVPVKAEGAPGH